MLVDVTVRHIRAMVDGDLDDFVALTHPQVAFVGPPRQPVDLGWRAPAWWRELSGRRVVLVNQGTVATDADQLIRPALAGLAGEDVLVVAATGGGDPAGLEPLPANARVPEPCRRGWRPCRTTKATWSRRCTADSRLPADVDRVDIPLYLTDSGVLCCRAS
ncbi:glycosyltransferase [Pseudofrankia sp. BMG5.37]|uniref:glycosyltransferase n=1 Tax=Pseudofrankia sp. BMG5.37 TaxID=3050035 RepID=UPI0008DB1122|nr:MULTISPECIES: hypothetical protein [unclassified Pseudofrankia]MDT3440227.1 hypothetical protein [Pseudofrankia sp. BMG5.37]OHV42638.1 hypothetical protein BCD48_30380 [Pseudofrankia sp. BMG5.36]